MSELVEELRKADLLLNDDNFRTPTFGDLTECQKIIRGVIAALDGKVCISREDMEYANVEAILREHGAWTRDLEVDLLRYILKQEPPK